MTECHYRDYLEEHEAAVRSARLNLLQSMGLYAVVVSLLLVTIVVLY